MPYIKISDPNIIDLSAWQQVINVINQHSDTLSAITNNFGLQGSGVTDWNGEEEIYEEFNAGSQKILYGKFRINTTDVTANGTKDLSANGDRMFYETIDFDNGVTNTSTFKAKPIVTVTPALVASVVSGTAPTTRNSGLICTVIGITDKGFTVRVIKGKEFSTNVEQGSTVADPKPTVYFDINWIAIGPK
jgi:hypothetical protein